MKNGTPLPEHAVETLLASLAGGYDLKGYSALWNYLAGLAAYQADQAKVAQVHFLFMVSLLFLAWYFSNFICLKQKENL